MPSVRSAPAWLIRAQHRIAMRCSTCWVANQKYGPCISATRRPTVRPFPVAKAVIPPTNHAKAARATTKRAFHNRRHPVPDRPWWAASARAISEQTLRRMWSAMIASLTGVVRSRGYGRPAAKDRSAHRPFAKDLRQPASNALGCARSEFSLKICRFQPRKRAQGRSEARPSSWQLRGLVHVSGKACLISATRKQHGTPARHAGLVTGELRTCRPIATAPRARGCSQQVGAR